MPIPGAIDHGHFGLFQFPLSRQFEGALEDKARIPLEQPGSVLRALRRHLSLASGRYRSSSNATCSVPRHISSVLPSAQIT